MNKIIVFKYLLASSAITLQPLAAQVLPSTQSGEGKVASEDTQHSGIEDIVVFGQRRSAGESAQKVPMAVTALNPTLLQSANTVDITNLGALAPNVQTPTVGTTPGFPNFSIRGIGVNSSIRSVDPAVNIIQDGMVIAYQAGSLQSTFDLESVEVLRGPQGVLFGRNATGGAISLRTRRPQRDFQILADVSYGNFNTLEANTSVEGGIAGDTVLAKLAILYRRGDGFIKNTNKGIFVAAPGNPSGARSVHETGQVGGVDEFTIKPTVHFQISDGTELTLFGQYQRYNDDASMPRNFVPSTGPSVPLQTVYGYTPVYGKYETNLTDDGYLRLRSGHLVAELVNRIGEAKFTTIGSFRRVSFDSTTNFAGGPFLLFFFPDNREDNTQYSFESRMNVPLSLEKLDLTAGVYYLNSKVDVLENRQQGGGAVSPLTNIFSRGTFSQETEAAAAFANVDWHLTDRLTVSGGGRYSSEKKSFRGAPLTGCIGQSFTNCPQAFTSAAKRWNNFSPRVVVNYQAADRVLLYLSYAKGFRSGNFNNRVVTAAGFSPASPEMLTSYEAGLKADLLDRSLRVNIAAFAQKYDDIQQVLTANVPGAGPVQTLVNAASADIRGGEIEITIQPIDALRLEINAGYTDAQFKSFTIPIAGVPDPTQLKFARVPKYNVTVAANYKWNMAGLPGDFNGRISYDYRSEFYTDFLNTRELAQPGYGLLNANLTYDAGEWSIGLFGRNIGNVDYADVKGRSLSYIKWGGQPRTYGVRLTAKVH